jgi:enoyl-CoA hydratase/carnithine racemase
VQPRQLEFCSVRRQGPVTIVTIDRPEVRNALHRPASLELESVFDDFAADADAWVAIVTGAGDKAFCAGNDLKYQAAGNATQWPDSGFGGLTARFSMDKPVIAAVNGLALGGGFEIALACDLIVAAETAQFALPEPHVGLAATAGGLLRLPHQIPLKRAMAMILTGQRVSAEEGHAWGFVNEVVPQGQVLDVAMEWADRILKGAPLAVRAAKALVRHGLCEPDLARSYPVQKQLPAVAALYSSADRIEGPLAFAEKRAPVWQGR